MNNDKSLDVTGLGKVAQAIPPESWKEAVKTATDTASSILAPLTAATSGIGRLIAARFDRLVDMEKILAADLLTKAKNKIKQGKMRISKGFNPNVTLACIEHSSAQFDCSLRELWANLLSHELTQNDIHPEMPFLLSRLTHNDALILSSIAENDKTVRQALIRNALLSRTAASEAAKARASYRRSEAKPTLSHTILSSMRLIEKTSAGWTLTNLGKEFVRAVSDPTSEEKQA